MYFVGSAATAGVEFTAAGILMQHWFPSVPIWIWCAVFMVLLFVLNALTTKGFAEAEFWFASIKVVAVIAFIIIGGAAIFGLIPLADRPTPHLTNLAPSGLFPAGITIIFVTMMNVIFSYQGSELVGIAAGETENPEKIFQERFVQFFSESSFSILLPLLYCQQYSQHQSLVLWRVHLSR